jgi:Ca2+-binding RTX toxin-like protein
MAGVLLPTGGSYTVAADITGATPNYYGIESEAAGTITNPGHTVSGGSTTTGEGILVAGGAGAITNETGGNINGFWGVILTDGGSVANNSGATISANGRVAVYSNLTASASAVNDGTITGAYDGVALLGGGSVTNDAGATITGTSHYGVYVASSPTIAASVTNAGSITGGINAISFGPIGGLASNNPGGANTVTLEGGSSLSGNVVGSIATGATNTLILQGTGSTSSVFSNFTTVEEGASANWTLSGVSTFGTADITGNSSTLSLAGGATKAVISGSSDTFTESVSSSTVTISGASDTVTVTGNNNTITVENASATVTATGTGNIQIWTPTISGTVANQATKSEAAIKPFSGVAIGDKTSGETDTDTLTITLGGSGGTLSGTGLSGGAGGVYTLTGSAATITTDLQGLSFTPTAGAPNTSSTTTFKLSDVTSLYATATVDTTTSVIDTDPAVAPTITGTVANQPTTSEAAVKPFSGVTIGDKNSGATETLTITVGGTGGTLSGAGLSGGPGGIYTLSGTASTVTSELEALSFTPTAGAPNSSSTTTFKLSDLSSAFSTPTVNTTTSVVDTDGGTIYGGAGNNTIEGGDTNVTIYGGTGSHQIYAGNGNDTFVAGSGNDFIVAGNGSDWFYGGSGNDSMYGGSGTDVFVGGSGTSYESGSGNDYFYLSDGNGSEAYGGSGNSVFIAGKGDAVMVGGSGNDTMFGGPGNDYFYGGSGNDKFFGGAGDDVMVGGPGNDYFNGGTGLNYYFGGKGGGPGTGLGHDTFVLKDTHGRRTVDLVQDWTEGKDHVKLVGTGLTSFADLLSHSYQDGAYFVIQPDANHSIWLNGATAGSVAASDFKFVK